jgi:hypothetical protein
MTREEVEGLYDICTWLGIALLRNWWDDKGDQSLFNRSIGEGAATCAEEEVRV